MNFSTVRHRVKDGYIHATDLCKLGGKQWKHYNENKSTKLFLQALSIDLAIDINKLVESTAGGIAQNQGTWVHPRVAIHLAQWLRTEFAVHVTTWIENWRLDCSENNDIVIDAFNAITPGEGKNNHEAVIRDRIADDENGQTEVKCDAGIADIVTAEYVIEVKCANNWKHALGQVIAYGFDFPGHQKRIHLFDMGDCDIDMIRTRCESVQVEVTIE